VIREQLRNGNIPAQERGFVLLWLAEKDKEAADVAARPEPPRGCHVNLELAEREVEGLALVQAAVAPSTRKRFASESAERVAGNEMALDVEWVLNCGMNRQEPLC
jgi:hypothetical protein